MKKVLCVLLVVLIIGCSNTIPEDTKEKTPEPPADPKYNQALTEISQRDDSNIRKRALFVNKELNRILESQEEPSMVDFVRIKIELDYIGTTEFNKTIFKGLRAKFVRTFTQNQQPQEPTKGLSLRDRFLDASRQVEALSAKPNVSVSEYLQVESDLAQLLEDGYPTKTINEQRATLLLSVMAGMETAILEYEIPDLEEKQDPQEQEETKKTPEPPTQEKESQIPQPEPPKGPQTITVNLIAGGFSGDNLSIQVGDTIIFKNIRERQPTVALMIGNRECRDLRSKFFQPGESYQWTFKEPMTCWVSDGIFVTQALRIRVKE